MNKENLTKRILIPLGLTLLFLLTISMVSIYWLQRLHFNEEVELYLKEIEQLFQMKLDEDAKVLESQINFLQLDKDLQNAYLARDREALIRHSTPFFNSIKAKYQVTHFYFIDLDRICFLRIHNPARYGDIIPRFTLDGAVRKNTPVYGIELGKFGTFTLRVVYPWRVNGELIGYIELGKEIEHITVALKKILGVELFFAVNKLYLNRTDWEEGLKMMERTGDWMLFSSLVIIDQTIPSMPKVFKEYINSPSLFSKHEHLTTIFKVSIGDKSYRGGFVPLIDAGQREVGHIAVLNDVSEKETALHTLSVILISCSIIIGGALFGFFYFFIGRIEVRLVKVHNELITSEKQIRGQHQFLQNVLDSLSHPFYVINVEDFTIKIANAAAKFGQLSKDSICYKLTHHTDQPCNSDECICPITEVQKTKQSVMVEHIHYDLLGNAVNIEVHGYPIFDESDNVKQMAVYTIDITERKCEVEKALREREAQYYGIFNATTDAFIIFNFAKKIIEANPQAHKMYGYSEAEFARLHYKSFIHPDFYSSFEHLYSNIQNTGEFQMESVNIRKDGTVFNAEIRGTAFNYKGETHLLAIIRDITEREQMLKNLAQAKEAAESANYAKSAFIANMNHELRTPLNAVLGFAQLLMNDKTLNSKQQNAVRTIYQSGDHLLLLLNDILDMSIIEAGKMQINTKDFYLHNFLRRVVNIFQIRIQEKNIDFICEFQPDLPRIVNGDEGRLRQVLINLLGNALKFTDKGQVTFKISQHENRTRFQIEDTGCGIASEELGTLFEPFKKIGDYTHKTEGSGLGLYLSKKWVDMMGGTLKVESTLDIGSIFWFDLVFSVINGKKSSYKPSNTAFKSDNVVQTNKETGKVTLVGPSPKVAKMLYHLAMQGNVGKLVKQATQLEQDDKLKPFATELLRLADVFKVRKIRELIEPFL